MNIPKIFRCEAPESSLETRNEIRKNRHVTTINTFKEQLTGKTCVKINHFEILDVIME